MLKVLALFTIVFFVLRLLGVWKRTAAIPKNARFRVTIYHNGRPAEIWYAREIAKKNDGLVLTEAATAKLVAFPSMEGIVLEDLRRS